MRKLHVLSTESFKPAAGALLSVEELGMLVAEAYDDGVAIDNAIQGADQAEGTVAALEDVLIVAEDPATNMDASTIASINGVANMAAVVNQVPSENIIPGNVVSTEDWSTVGKKIKDVVSKIWADIVAFLKQMWGMIKQVFGKYKTIFESYQDSLRKIHEALSKNGVFKFTGLRGGKLHVSDGRFKDDGQWSDPGKLAEGWARMRQATTNLFVNSLEDHKAVVAGATDFVQEILMIGEGSAAVDIQKATVEYVKKVKAGANKVDLVAHHEGTMYLSHHLPGGKVLYILDTEDYSKELNAGGDVNPLKVLGALSRTRIMLGDPPGVSGGAHGNLTIDINVLTNENYFKSAVSDAFDVCAITLKFLDVGERALDTQLHKLQENTDKLVKKAARDPNMPQETVAAVAKLTKHINIQATGINKDMLSYLRKHTGALVSACGDF